MDLQVVTDPSVERGPGGAGLRRGRMRSRAGTPGAREEGSTMDKSQNPGSDEQRENTDLDELNDQGVGGTIGAKDTFEPEETEDPDAEKK